MRCSSAFSPRPGRGFPRRQWEWVAQDDNLWARVPLALAGTLQDGLMNRLTPSACLPSFKALADPTRLLLLSPIRDARMEGLRVRPPAAPG